MLAALVLADPALAVRTAEPSAFTEYVRARAADAQGLSDVAAAQYAKAMAAQPSDTMLALRAFRQAEIAGDKALALRAARQLDAARALPADGRLLLLLEAFERKDWAGATALVDQIEKEQLFSFMGPVIRAWIAQGSGKGDALALVSRPTSGALAGAYSAEHRILLMLAGGRQAEAVDAIKTFAITGTVRDTRLRLLAAQSLAASGDKAKALSLLAGGDAALEAMAAQINAGKRMTPPAIGPNLGLSELFIRVALDINRERVTPLSLALARFATFAAPDSGEAIVSTAQLLTLSGRDPAALATLAQISEADPFAALARPMRVRLLVNKGAKEDALAAIKAIVAQPQASTGDWMLLGDIYSALDRDAEAAGAYDQGLKLAARETKDDERLWTLWMLKGGALDRAGDWPAAKAALEQGLKLAPDEPVLLNYLGYAQLERGENIAGARTLIERASALKPDDAAITDSLGWALFLSGDVPSAIVKLEAASIGDPGGSEINEHLGDAYWAAGRKIEARYAWAAARVTADAKSGARLARKIDFGPGGETARP